MIRVKDTCPEDIKKTPMAHAKNVYWQIGQRSINLRSRRKECGSNRSRPSWKERCITDGQRGMQHKRGRGSQARSWTKKKKDCTTWVGRTPKNRKCCEAEGTEKHRLYHCEEWWEERNKMPDAVRSCEMKARTWQRGLESYPTLWDTWAARTPGKQKWITHTSRSWDRRVECFRTHIATDGSLKKSFRKRCGVWLGSAARLRQGRRAMSTPPMVRCWLSLFVTPLTPDDPLVHVLSSHNRPTYPNNNQTFYLLPPPQITSHSFTGPGSKCQNITR